MYCPYKQEELVIKEIEDFWPGVIAYGFPVYINGSTGLGKTNVFLKIGADATRGIFPPGVKDGFLEEPMIGDPIRIFYVSTENPCAKLSTPHCSTTVRIRRCSKFKKKKMVILSSAHRI